MKKSWMCFKLDPGTSEKGIPDSSTKIKVASEIVFKSRKDVQQYIKDQVKLSGVYFPLKVYIKD